MNVWCIKDETLMVPHNNEEYVCLKCECRVRVKKGYSVEMWDAPKEGAPEYNDV